MSAHQVPTVPGAAPPTSTWSRPDRRSNLSSAVMRGVPKHLLIPLLPIWVEQGQCRDKIGENDPGKAPAAPMKSGSWVFCRWKNGCTEGNWHAGDEAGANAGLRLGVPSAAGQFLLIDIDTITGLPRDPKTELAAAFSDHVIHHLVEHFGAPLWIRSTKPGRAAVLLRMPNTVDGGSWFAFDYRHGGKGALGVIEVLAKGRQCGFGGVHKCGRDISWRLSGTGDDVRFPDVASVLTVRDFEAVVAAIEQVNSRLKVEHGITARSQGKAATKRLVRAVKTQTEPPPDANALIDYFKRLPNPERVDYGWWCKIMIAAGGALAALTKTGSVVAEERQQLGAEIANWTTRYEGGGTKDFMSVLSDWETNFSTKSDYQIGWQYLLDTGATLGDQQCQIEIKNMEISKMMTPLPMPAITDGRPTNDNLMVVGPEYSDDALALAFTACHAGRYLYVPTWGHWLTWDGCRWAQDNVLEVYDLVRQTCRQAAAEAAGGDAKPEMARKLTSGATIASVERMARSDPRHARAADDFDSDPWVLNTPGGVVDLKTGMLRPHRPEDLFTKVAGATPGGACPRFLAFLAEITQGDQDLVDYLQKFIGYTLTGAMTEQSFVFIHGPGGNGKGVLFATLATMMGEYATTATADVFMLSRNEQHPTTLAALRGARMVAVTETDEGRGWAEARIKAITGGDRISARVMRGDPFEFSPVCKLWFSGNYKPTLKNADAAMRRRMNVVPMTYIPPRPDKGLEQALKAEGGGILAWAVQGCLQWQRGGLTPPARVVSATDDYFNAQDTLGEWLAERCEVAAGTSTSSSQLYASWASWARGRGEEAGSNKRFSDLIERRHAKKKTSAGVVFTNLRLIPEAAGVGGQPSNATQERGTRGELKLIMAAG